MSTDACSACGKTLEGVYHMVVMPDGNVTYACRLCVCHLCGMGLATKKRTCKSCSSFFYPHCDDCAFRVSLETADCPHCGTSSTDGKASVVGFSEGQGKKGSSGSSRSNESSEETSSPSSQAATQAAPSR